MNAETDSSNKIPVKCPGFTQILKCLWTTMLQFHIFTSTEIQRFNKRQKNLLYLKNKYLLENMYN